MSGLISNMCKKNKALDMSLRGPSSTDMYERANRKVPLIINKVINQHRAFGMLPDKDMVIEFGTRIVTVRDRNREERTFERMSLRTYEGKKLATMLFLTTPLHVQEIPRGWVELCEFSVMRLSTGEKVTAQCIHRPEENLYGKDLRQLVLGSLHLLGDEFEAEGIRVGPVDDLLGYV